MRHWLRALVLSSICFVLWAGVTSPALGHGLLVTRTAEPPTPSPSAPLSPPAPPAPLAQAVVLGIHRVEVVVEGQVASVTVEQVFRNRTDARLEGDYLFPLPEGAAVSRFAMTMGGKLVEGEVMDAGKARQIYESIVRRRRDPGLLEYVGRGLYRARVFPIEPKGDVRIQLGFQQILPEHDGTLELRYPLATDRLHGEPVEDAVITVEIESDIGVKAVYSPSHRVAVVRKSDRRVSASFEQSQKRQDRDFVLYVGRSEDRVGGSVISQKAPGEDGTFLAVLTPSVARGDLPEVPKDVVFVLDTSGSMRENDKLAQAKRALTYGVNILRPGDRFNVVAFSTEVRPFRENLVEVGDTTKAAALSWISGLMPAGGTGIGQALTTTLGMGQEGRLFLVVFLTDGKPTIGTRSTPSLVKMVERANVSDARVFTFGVGYDLAVELLDKIAEATGGARDYVMPKDEMEIVTSRFFRKVTEPVLTDLELDFGGAVHDVYPRVLPDLFAGSQITVLGRYAEPGQRTLRLQGKVGAQAVEYVWRVHFANEEGAAYLPRLWAQRKVAYLLDAIRLNGEEKELVDEVKRLATRYAIVTPYTAGLVVEDAELEATQRGAGRGWARGGPGGQYRGPGDHVPPGLREPSDPTPASPAPPPPPSGPPMPTPTPTTPSAPRTPGSPPPPTTAPDTRALEKLREIERSKRLRREKDAAHERPTGRVKQVAGKTFVWKRDGTWTDTAWKDELGPPQEIEAFSDAWTKLAELGPKVVKILALGDRVLFVWEGKAYRIVPAP